MKKIPANEMRLAIHMVAGFSHESGETSLDYLSDLCAVDEGVLRSWAAERGYLYDDGEGISMGVLPTLWEAFAGDSRVCLALHSALQELLDGAHPESRISLWVKECHDDLNRAPLSFEAEEWVQQYLSKHRAESQA
jgi:hypothetical protein